MLCSLIIAFVKFAVVAQSVEHFLGKEEVRQFKSAQQLHLLINKEERRDGKGKI